jgi:hypothetical protein
MNRPAAVAQPAHHLHAHWRAAQWRQPPRNRRNPGIVSLK